MPKINDWTIQQIKDRARIEDIVLDCLGSYDPHTNPTGLRKKGVRYTAICPFHNDRHDGNFIVHPGTNTFRCFACDAKGGPVDFLMKHEGLSYPDALRYLAKKYNVDIDMQDFNYTPPPPRPAPPPKPTLVLPLRYVTQRMVGLERNALVQWILSDIKWDGAQAHRIPTVLTDYCVGHSPRTGMTIWWQIDEQQQVHTGKLMLYKADGHRDKTEGKYTFDWVHSTLSRHPDSATGKMTYDPPYPYPDIYNPDKQEMRQCLFGMHLLNKYKKEGVAQEVCIVESEKTAVLMAIAYGNHTGQVWMACGGIENLSREKLRPIIEQQRTIRLCPDRDGIDRWKDKAEQLHYDHVTLDTTPVTKWWKPEDGEKADIADVVINSINSHDTPLHPLMYDERVKALIERLQLIPLSE